MSTHTTVYSISALHTCLNTHRRIMGSLCTQKMLATAPQIARATLGRAIPLAHPNAPSRALYEPGVARPRPQRSHNLRSSTCVLPTRPKASWDSFARKRCSQLQYLPNNPRNSQGRATNRSPIQMRYLVRYTGPEWRTHGPRAHNRRNATRACSQHAQRPITGSLCTQKVCARNMRYLKSLGRATNLSSIKMHHIERHTAVSGASSTRTHAQKHPACLLGPPSKRLPGPICTQNVLTTYGTSESARISWTSEQTLAHQNASCRALHGS